MIHFLYYRIGLMWGLWGTLLARTLAMGLVGAAQAAWRAWRRRARAARAPLPASEAASATREPATLPASAEAVSRAVARPAARFLGSTVLVIGQSVFAAFLGNVVYWLCIEVLYLQSYTKGTPLFAEFSAYTQDVFGFCAQGPSYNEGCLDASVPAVTG